MWCWSVDSFVLEGDTAFIAALHSTVIFASHHRYRNGEGFGIKFAEAGYSKNGYGRRRGCAGGIWDFIDRHGVVDGCPITGKGGGTHADGVATAVVGEGGDIGSESDVATAVHIGALAASNDGYGS